MPNLKISELSSAASLTGSEVLPIVQSGQTVKTTVQDITNLYAPVVLPTYQALHDLLIAEALVPGTRYEVPYRSVNWLNGWTLASNNPTPIDPSFNPRQIHTGEEEILIVEAISSTELSQVAYSKQHPEDIIQYEPYANKIGVLVDFSNGNVLPNSTTVSGFDLQWDGTNVYFNMPAGYPALYGQAFYLYCEFTNIAGDYYQDGTFEPLLPGVSCQYPYSNALASNGYPKIVGRIKLFNAGYKVVLLDLTEEDYNNYTTNSLYVQTIQALGEAYGWITRRSMPLKEVSIPFDFRAVTYRRYEVNTATLLPSFSWGLQYIGIGDNWELQGTTGNYIDFLSLPIGNTDSQNVYFNGVGGPYCGYYSGANHNNVNTDPLYSVKVDSLYYANNTFLGNDKNNNIISTNFYNNVFGSISFLNLKSLQFYNNYIKQGETNNITVSTFFQNKFKFFFQNNMNNANSVAYNDIQSSFSGNTTSSNVTGITGFAVAENTFNGPGLNMQLSTSLTFQKNVIGPGFINTSYNYTSATHVYNDYQCNFFKNSAGVERLSYTNGSDVLTVVNPTT